MKSSRSLPAFTLAAALAVGTLAACGGGDESSDSDGTVDLKVAIDAGLEQSAIDAFNERIAQFEDANPDINVETQEYTWTATTFTAELAGDTLPDVFTVPFTDGRGLIEREQIADISDLIAELPYADKYNPKIAEAGQAADGGIWAVPISAYGQALHYNRTLFTQAGLDPDSPPTTWEEVRTAAKQIAEKTGVAGYAQMTSGNTGGWILTTLNNAFGGTTEQIDGDKATATLDTPEMAEVLDTVRAMRWEDNSMGANFLYDWGTINQDFAAGQIGMYVSGGGNYGNLKTQNGLNPDDYGVTVLPLADNADAGTLGGGTLAVVRAKADEVTKEAAVKWIDFYYMSKLTVEDAAKLDAKARADSGAPVGEPELPVFDKATYEERLGWLSEYVNVPLEQMTPYTENVFDQPLVTEPKTATQEIYALLDPVVQTVLTDQNADVKGLLATAEADAQAIIDSQ